MGQLDPANGERPGHAIYDLGCGAGNISRLLAERFPNSPVVGIDSSEDMLAKARGHARVTIARGEGPYLDGRRPSQVHFLGDIEGDLARQRRDEPHDEMKQVRGVDRAISCTFIAVQP